MREEVIVDFQIKQIRKSKNISQRELANRININRTTLSRYETGKRIPDIFVLWDIADELDVSLDDLVKGRWDK